MAAGHSATITVMLSYGAARALLAGHRKLAATLRLLNTAGSVRAKRSVQLRA